MILRRLTFHDDIADFSSSDGKETLLKDGLKLQAGEIIDAATMSKIALTEFYTAQIEDSKKQNILLSLHLKVVMITRF